MAWQQIKRLCFKMVIGPLDEEEARRINKYSKHKVSVLYKKALTRLSHTGSQAFHFNSFSYHLPQSQTSTLLDDLTNWRNDTACLQDVIPLMIEQFKLVWHSGNLAGIFYWPLVFIWGQMVSKWSKGGHLCQTGTTIPEQKRGVAKPLIGCL